MQSRHHTNAAERGSTLLTAVVVLSVLAVLSAAYLHMGMATSREVTSRIDNERSFFLAESAIGEGVSALRGGGTGNVGSQANPAFLSDGMMWVESTDLGGLEYQLDARAAVGGGRTALQVIVNGSGSTYGSGLMAIEHFYWGNNGLVDSWNSNVSDYPSAVDPLTGFANSNVSGRANLHAELGANTEFHGDMYPGPEDTVSIVSAGVNYYIDGNNLKWQADVGVGLDSVPSNELGINWRRDNPGDDGQVVVRTQLQLLF